MKISKKQKEEVDFLYSWRSEKKSYNQEEVEDFINVTVYGKDSVYHKEDVLNRNFLLESKRFLEITIGMWREDLTLGMLGVEELRNEWPDSRYAQNLITSLMNSISASYRTKVMTKNPQYVTPLAVTNFPEISKLFETV